MRRLIRSGWWVVPAAVASCVITGVVLLNPVREHAQETHAPPKREDFDFSCDFIDKNNIEKHSSPILFSPNLDIKGLANDLSKWILESNRNIIFQPQLHKLIPEEKLDLLTA